MKKNRLVRKVLVAVIILITQVCLAATLADGLRFLAEDGLPYFFLGETVAIEYSSGTDMVVLDKAGNTIQKICTDAEGKAEFHNLPVGYYECRVGKDISSFVVTYPLPGKDSVVGIDAHLSDCAMYLDGQAKTSALAESVFRRHLIIAQHTGATYLRERFRWEDFESEPGKWSDEIFDRYYLPQIKAGFKLIPAVEGLVQWAAATDGKYSCFGSPTQKAWEGLFKQLSRRYGDKIKYLQVWNEPNPRGISGALFPGGITPEKFIDAYLKGARLGVDTVGKSVKLVLGGSAGMDMTWQKGLIDSGALKYLDIYDIHPYNTGPFTFEPQMMDVVKSLSDAGFKGPIMGTEFNNESADEVAQMYIQWFSLDRQMRNGVLFHFDLRDWPGSTGAQTRLQLGLANIDYSPKPKLAAVNIIAHRFAGAKHVRTVYHDEEKKVSVELIRDYEDRFFGTLYTEGENGVVCLYTDSPEVELAPACGGKNIRVKTLEGIAVLPVMDKQLFYIDGIKTLEPATSIVMLKKQPSLTSIKLYKGKQCPYLTWNISNPLQKPIELNIECSVDCSVTVLDPTRSLRLGPGESKSIDYLLTSKNAFAIQDYSGVLSLNEKSKGFKVEVPLRFKFQNNPEFEVTLERNDKAEVRLLTIKFTKDVAGQINTVRASIGDIKKSMKLIGKTQNEYIFENMIGSFSEIDRNRVIFQVKLSSGVEYQFEHFVTMDNLVDQKQEMLNGDIGTTLYMAQPFRPIARTLSAVAMQFNNWSGKPFDMKIRISRDRPDGLVVGRANATVTTGSGWIRFQLERLVTDINPGALYWIVTENSGNDEIRWTAMNPLVDREADALSSHEGAAWTMFQGREDFAWCGLTYRTYK